MCIKLFKTKDSAKAHYESIHLEADFEFCCPECGSTHCSGSALRMRLKKKHDRVVLKVGCKIKVSFGLLV